jgi:sec-independent protein translocase protein TatA
VGGPELIIILFIVLIIFGAGKLGNIGGDLGKAIREFKVASSGSNDKDKPAEAKAATEESA